MFGEGGHESNGQFPYKEHHEKSEREVNTSEEVTIKPAVSKSRGVNEGNPRASKERTTPLVT